MKDRKYTSYAIGYKNATPEEEQLAEFAIFKAIRNFIETVELDSGEFVKILRADILLDNDSPRESVKPKNSIILPDNGLVIN